MSTDNLESNYNIFVKLTQKCGDRSTALSSLVDRLGERLAICPAHDRRERSTAKPGGLIEHSLNVVKTMKAIETSVGFGVDPASMILVGLYHDIGKVGIPDHILLKPGRLDEAEMAIMRQHASLGHDLLKGSSSRLLQAGAIIALGHHEKFDGSGYPQGLKGEEILLEARILAVADVVEAMSSDRPYRPGLGIDSALAEIERGRGSAYDPGVADACLKLFRELGYTIPA
jgi:putative nucleotidyltransferase with HDIG domain